MNIEYKNNYAIFNGERFKKDNKTGYYLSSGNLVNGKRIRLHRYIWEYYYGEIPKGYDIHHKDHNKDNNDISNLEMLLKEEHIDLHKREITDETRNKYRENMNENARPKAIEWHKSIEGSKWHKEQYKISLGKLEPQKFICKNCNKEYYSMNVGTNSFCSNKCKSAYRRKSGIDDILRNCIICGKQFKINKYSKKIKCDECKKKE